MVSERCFVTFFRFGVTYGVGICFARCVVHLCLLLLCVLLGLMEHVLVVA